MAYEIFYACVVTDTAFERAAFLVWFLCDFIFAVVAVRVAYPPAMRSWMALKLSAGVSAGLLFFRFLTAAFPDEREQVTAYWTGWLLQLPIGWGSLFLLLRDRTLRGHSLEIWCGSETRSSERRILTPIQDHQISGLPDRL